MFRKYFYTFIDWLHENRDFKIYDKAWDENSTEIMDQLYAKYRGWV